MKASKRDYYIDNLKIVLAILVVIGHFSMQFDWVPPVVRINRLIYTFHMPLFVFVSGYLAKGVYKNGRFRSDKVLMFLWLYLLFKLLLASERWLFGKGFELGLFSDQQAPWYLFAMAVWYLLIPFLESMKKEWVLAGSIVLGVLIGYCHNVGRGFTMSRSIVFLPFFLMGYYLSSEGLHLFLNLKRLRRMSAVLLAGIGLVYLFQIELLKPYLGLIYGGTAYHKVASLPSELWGGPLRLFWYALAMILSMLVMQLIPRKQTWFSKYGSRTLQIYILHIAIRNPLAFAGFFDYFKELPDLVNTAIVWGGAILLSFVLGNQWFTKAFQVISGANVFRKVMK